MSKTNLNFFRDQQVPPLAVGPIRAAMQINELRITYDCFRNSVPGEQIDRLATKTRDALEAAFRAAWELAAQAAIESDGVHVNDLADEGSAL